jgi:dephospho-CoA kinase
VSRANILRVGLTGGIGSGKSTVSAMFAALGVPVIDADCIGRDLVKPGASALEAIIGRFGASVLTDGELDRAKLRLLIFSDADAKHWLETLLHPSIYEEMHRQALGVNYPYCLLVVPLLLETGRRNFVDRLLVVDCDAALQVARVQARNGLSKKDIDRMRSAQAGRSERLAAADDILKNNGGLASLEMQVKRLHALYLRIASGAIRQGESSAGKTID